MSDSVMKLNLIIIFFPETIRTLFDEVVANGKLHQCPFMKRYISPPSRGRPNRNVWSESGPFVRALYGCCEHVDTAAGLPVN